MRAVATLAMILCVASAPAAADGLIDRVADLTCIAARAERTAFDALGPQDVAFPVDTADAPYQWTPIGVELPRPSERKAVIVTVDYAPEEHRFVRIQVGDGHRLHYALGHQDSWINTAWNAGLHLFRFGDVWMALADADGRPPRFMQLPQLPSVDGIGLIAPGSVAIVASAYGSCQYATEPEAMCWSEFVIRLPLATRLTGLSDFESVLDHTVGNDAFTYDVKLWGLSGPQLPEGCE